MAITTKFTETFGVEHPIAQGGMQWVARTATKHQDRGDADVMGLIDIASGNWCRGSWARPRN